MSRMGESSNEALDSPTPAVKVQCLLCGSDEHEIICHADEVQAHRAYLLQFHKRRLRRNADGSLPEAALEDRVEFTQNHATGIVSCTVCGLVFRNPQPPSEAIARAYSQDHYDGDFLATAFDNHLELSRAKANTLERWLPRKKGIRVVEVGSFIGGFLAAGQEKGWDMLGWIHVGK